MCLVLPGLNIIDKNYLSGALSKKGLKLAQYFMAQFGSVNIATSLKVAATGEFFS
jgi:hypothetical protein